MRFCRAVLRAGGPERAPNEGPLDFAARATAALPASAEPISRITGLYVEARYGRALEGSAPAVEGLRDALRRFRPRREAEPQKN